MKKKTLIGDLIEGILSRTLSPDEAREQAGNLDVALSSDGVAQEMKRYQARMKKQNQRGKKTHPSQGQSPLDIYSSTSQQTQSIQEKEEVKKDSYVAVVDDWPSDFGEQFWKAYIGPRKYDRPKVFAKLAKLRADKTVTWAALMAGLDRYKATNPENKFIPAPMVWLNQHRWEADFGTRGPNGTNPTSPNNPSGPTDNYAAAAARRFGPGSGNGPARGTAASVQPAGRRGDDGQGPRGSFDAFSDTRPPYGR